MINLEEVWKRYSKALDAKPSKGPVTRWDDLTDSVADIPDLIKEIERMKDLYGEI